MLVEYDEGAEQRMLARSDWLGSSPIFFNTLNREVNPSISRLTPTPTTTEDFDQEGLSNYLDFGFSVFGKTPLEGLRFLEPNSSIWRKSDGELVVKEHPDPFFESRTTLSESDVIDLLKASVQEWERGLPRDHSIVLPLSGGLDSRLLLWAVGDKSRVRAYTYGTAPKQAMSSEVVYARELAGLYGIQWDHIQLGGFHSCLEPWYDQYGLSTHAHGMYQMEFYSKIRQTLEGEHSVLSGIVGDAWAGSIKKFDIKETKDLQQLGYAHGLSADSSRLRSRPESLPTLENFFTSYREFLSDPKFQAVSVVRLKMILLSYLLEVPKQMGFQAWSPFLRPDLALAMLDIDPSRRRDRAWQKEFFVKEGIMPETSTTKRSTANTLDYQGLRAVPLRGLAVDQLGSLFDRKYIEWVNYWIGGSCSARLQNNLLAIPKVGGGLRRFQLAQSVTRAYAAYLCLFPIEMSLGRSE